MSGNQPKLVAKYGDLKRKKLKICPNSPKNLADFVTFFLEIWRFLKKNSKNFP
jgi:hypothetical protein